MAIVRMEPVEVRVRADWFDGTPREITWGHLRLPVTSANCRSSGALSLSGST